MLSEQCGNSLNIYGPSVDETCIGSKFLYFLTLINYLIRNTCEISDPKGRIIPKTKPDNEYDFVIIGSGTAGSTVTGRLAEIKNWKILLLEAGDDEPAGTQVPSFSFVDSAIDWQFKTEPETLGCQGFPEKRCTWPRGKVLGGTSVLNGMMFVRGTPKDYEKWVEAGNPDWSYENNLPYFKQSEDMRDASEIDAPFHGQKGPVRIERFRYQPKIAWDILKGGKEIGFNISEDLNGIQQNGFAIPHMNNKNGVRLSLAKAYLRPQKNNRNLHIMLNSTVTKILIDNNNNDGDKRATRIRFSYNNGEKKIIYEVKVKKDVIVSAGAVQTPQILMLSGIGDKEHLNSIGIELIHELRAVGQGLKNHVSFELPIILKKLKYSENMLTTESLDEYLKTQTGPLSSTGLAQITARINSKYSTSDDPDIQFYFGGYDATCPSSTGILPNNNNNNNNDNEQKNSTLYQKISIFPTYIHSKSRGYISLHSNDPFQAPKIVANYLLEETDLNGLREGIRIGQKLINAPILQQKYGMKLEKLNYGVCSEQYSYDSDEFWNCAIKYQTVHENHQGSSCKMGKIGESCVNQRLQLYGIENIRIIDASIFPDLPSANPQATIIMVAERGATFIKQDYLNRVRRKT